MPTPDEQLAALALGATNAHLDGDTAAVLDLSARMGELTAVDLVRCHTLTVLAYSSAVREEGRRGRTVDAIGIVAETIGAHMVRRMDGGA